jgi:pimeloyl-ACP methyl ester carboxylesterase
MRSHPTYLVLFTVLTLSGCAGPALVSEQDDAELHGLIRAAQGMPARTWRVRVEHAGKPVHVAVHETGDGRGERVIVMLHGVLSDSAVWRFMCGELAQSCDVMTIDMPGCGRSDRPDPAVLGRGAYGPPMLARCVLGALRERLAARGDDDEAPVTLVAHSLGGMVTLRMFADPRIRAEYADVLDRVDGLVLFTPVDVAIEKDIPTFRAIAEVSDVAVAVADVTGLLKWKVATATREGVCDADRAVLEEAQRMSELLVDRPRRRAAQAMIRRAIPVRGSRPWWDKIEPIVQTYGNVDVPALIVWGARDELLPVSMGFKLHYHLPHARLHVINKGMHCLPVERPTQCVALVRDFIRNGHEAREAIVWVDGPTRAVEGDAQLAVAAE